MSPVNRTGLVFEISPHHSFLCKNFDVFSPVTEISLTGLDIFPYEHSSPVTGMKLERSPLIHLGNRAEISHMDSNRAEVLAR